MMFRSGRAHRVLGGRTSPGAGMAALLAPRAASRCTHTGGAAGLVPLHSHRHRRQRPQGAGADMAAVVGCGWPHHHRHQRRAQTAGVPGSDGGGPDPVEVAVRCEWPRRAVPCLPMATENRGLWFADSGPWMLLAASVAAGAASVAPGSRLCAPPCSDPMQSVRTVIAGAPEPRCRCPERVCTCPGRPALTTQGATA